MSDNGPPLNSSEFAQFAQELEIFNTLQVLQTMPRAMDR